MSGLKGEEPCATATVELSVFTNTCCPRRHGRKCFNEHCAELQHIYVSHHDSSLTWQGCICGQSHQKLVDSSMAGESRYITVLFLHCDRDWRWGHTRRDVIHRWKFLIISSPNANQILPRPWGRDRVWIACYFPQLKKGETVTEGYDLPFWKCDAIRDGVLTPGTVYTIRSPSSSFPGSLWNQGLWADSRHQSLWSALVFLLKLVGGCPW